MRRRAFLFAIAAFACTVPLTADAANPPKNPPGGAPALTIAAKPTLITFGRSATVSGRLTGNNHGNRPVGLQRNPWPFRGMVNAGVTRTATNGSYSFTVRPVRHTRYRAVTPQPATIYDTLLRSPEVLILVRLRVGIRLSDSTPTRGQRVRFFGSVAPKHNGRKVFIQRRRRDGRWRTVARTVTRNTTGRRSRYGKRVRIFRSGAYRVRVRGDADHRTGTSRARAIRVQ
ncbi:MAG TPA: hypothetical protein VF066_14505 [Thermoleophilaceae bacterium]